MITSTPSSGSLFGLGETTVTCTARDDVGNESECTFTVTVVDKEAPAIICPPAVTINIEESSAPARTGLPKVSDNCSAGQPTHVDKRTDGNCNSEFTLTRFWSVADVHSNENGCSQIIQVIDNTPPVITTPDNITVSCDTSISATGVATVQDHGDPNPKLSYTDVAVDGHCGYQCTIERTWRATDECGNTSTKVQVIEKDITPIVELALTEPLFLGMPESRNPTSFRVKPEEAGCIVQWLPSTNGRPTALVGGKQGVEGRRDNPNSCTPGSNPVDPATGSLTNPLFAFG